ncbi:Diadenosine tetraphosphate (Ap4A) hydrolase [Dyella jiangningensis]|jgi:diadenosine tetraphosphate (Ap4A) HIT family hydrolase|nr:diadenosine tetraphosphate (Ap4A) HIT family hydrolase [Dyella sp. AtDHG13]SDJ26656.1 Diadenosine tetraphosphate (Ap4A) hydrolase [Dyella jiangningensis]
MVRRDINPVASGHLLIITRRHVADFFEATATERASLMALLLEAKAWLAREYAPDGFNVGVNIGLASGQTIPHVHVHLIPRYLGDTPNPRGGVRGVIPDKQTY